MINIKNVDPNLVKIDKNVDIYYIGYITMKDSDYVKINSVNSLYLIINEVDGLFETLVSTDKNKEILTKNIEFWNGIFNSIEKINNKLGEYGKDF